MRADSKEKIRRGKRGTLAVFTPVCNGLTGRFKIKRVFTLLEKIHEVLDRHVVAFFFEFYTVPPVITR